MITKEMNQKYWQNIFHVVRDLNLIVQNVIQIKNGIKNCVNESAKIA